MAWESRPLGDVCRVIGGGTPSKDRVDFYQGTIPWATVRDMRADLITETECHITKEAVQSSATNVIPAGNVVIATRVGLGKVCLLNQATAINQDLRGIIPIDSKRLSVRFLFHWLKSVAHLIVAEGTGATVQGVKLPFIKSLRIPLPPLAEQQRIVAKLDEAFAAIDVAKANAERNLQNARALFESRLSNLFTHAYDTCKIISMTDIATDITDGDHMPPPKSQTGVPFITIGNIEKTTREIDFSDTFRVPYEYFKNLKTSKKPQKGDVLYTVTGSFGIPILIRSNVEFCFQRHIGLIRPRSNVNSEWLNYLCLSPQVFSQAQAGATGAAQKTVSLKLLRGFKIPDVALEQQDIIAKELNEFQKLTDQLKEIYDKTFFAYEKLRSSILMDAFSGKL